MNIPLVESLSTPMGELFLLVQDGSVIKMSWYPFDDRSLISTKRESSLNLNVVLRLLDSYFLNPFKFVFELSHSRLGSSFQNRVWQELTKISVGTTVSYKELGRRLGNPNLARAVGNANNANPYPIIIPCHRVIRAHGELGGYNGGGAIKEKLLDFERGYKKTPPKRGF